MAKIVAHARSQLALAKAPRVVAHHPFLLGKLLLEKKRVRPVELGICHDDILAALEISSEEVHDRVLIDSVAHRRVMVAAGYDDHAAVRERACQGLGRPRHFIQSAADDENVVRHLSEVVGHEDAARTSDASGQGHEIVPGALANSRKARATGSVIVAGSSASSPWAMISARSANF